jgi:hypothetical protein
LKHKKLIAFILFASLIGIFTVALIQQPQQSTPPFLPPTQTGAIQTAQIPSIQNFTSETLYIYPSASYNATGVVATEAFNETFFNISSLSGVSNILSLTAVFQSYSNPTSIDFSELNSVLLTQPVPTYYPAYLPWDQAIGIIEVTVSGTDSSAYTNCDMAMSQAFLQINQTLSTYYDISVQEGTSSTMTFGNLLFGALLFNALNTTDESYTALNGIIIGNTLTSTIAAENFPIHIIQIEDEMLNESGTLQPSLEGSYLIVGAMSEGQIGTTANGEYTFSTRNLLDITTPGTNITSQAPLSEIIIWLPTNCNITNIYPSTAVNFSPVISFSMYPGPLNVDDVNVTYTLLPSPALPTALLLALILSSTTSPTLTYIAIAGAAAAVVVIAIGLVWMSRRGGGGMPPTQTGEKKWKET